MISPRSNPRCLRRQNRRVGNSRQDAILPYGGMLFLDRMSRLRSTLCGVDLQNPVIAASGTYAYGIEFEKVADLNAIGGIVVKGLSRDPIPGNPPPRLYESEGGMINSIGLQNIGALAFVREKLPALRRFRCAIFANVF